MRLRYRALGCLACSILGPLACTKADKPTGSISPDAAVAGETSDDWEDAAPAARADDVNSGDATGSVGEPTHDTGVDGAESPAGDAGVPGANAVVADAEADAAQDSSDVACSGLFCEDFEQGQIDPTKWDLQTGAGGTLDIEEQIVAHGKYAMHVHGLAGPADYALIVTKNAPAALSAANFGRAYFFITPKPLTSGHTQMTFAGTNGTGPAEGPGPFPKLRYMEVANINGGWQIGFDLLDLSPLIEEVAYPAGSPQVPVATWSCLEWQFTDQPDVVNLWVDGAATGTFDNEHVSYPGGHTPGSPLYDGTSSGLIGGYTVFGFGFHDWHPNKPFDLYYDDIVLDTKRVGCLAGDDP